MSKVAQKELGTFKMETTKARVSDPCYTNDVSCKGTVSGCRKGTWKVYAVTSDEGSWGNRVAGLVAYHEDSPRPKDMADGKWNREKFEVGVDSGQAGIFDEKFYRDDTLEKQYAYKGSPLVTPDEEGDNWYNICCDVTLDGDNSACGSGVIPYGCVSSSGYGDGGYPCYTQKDDKGKVVAICIDYCLIGYCEECGSKTPDDELYWGKCDMCREAEEEEEEEEEEEDED